MEPEKLTEKLALFPYQHIGARFLSEKRFALLADVMGLGKTAQAIEACRILNAAHILVLCPAIARHNWAREFDMFWPVPRSVRVITASNQIDLWPEFANVTICSYDLAEILLERAFTKQPGQIDVLILDESHYLKSPDTKRTRAILGKEGLVHFARKTWCISGTPAPNHPGELWPILFTFGKIKLGYEKFVKKYCNYYEMNYQLRITGAKLGSQTELRALLKDFMLRRNKEEVNLELPPIFYSDIQVEPGPVDLGQNSSMVQWVFPTDRTHEFREQIAKEEALLNGIIEKMGGSRDALNTFEAVASSLSTLRRFTGLQKIKPTIDLVSEELDNFAYDKIVIFCIHRDVIDSLRKGLRRYGAVTVYGGTDQRTRQRHIHRFKHNPKCKVFIGNIQAAGTAITLTEAHQVLFVEQDWVPGNNAQAAMRCHRIGQKRSVFVRFMGVANSLDEKISKILKRKAKELTEIFDHDRLQGFEVRATQKSEDSILIKQNEAKTSQPDNEDMGDPFQ